MINARDDARQGRARGARRAHAAGQPDADAGDRAPRAQRITGSAAWTSAISADVAVIVAFTAAALVGGALTLRRQVR